MGDLDGGVLASIAGLGAGMVLGLAARLGRFCMMGSVEDAVYGADLRRIRTVALAAATAIAGTALLGAAGLFDPAQTQYARLGWSPLTAVLGGLMFGYGMAQVGTCGFGTLARLGGGDLRSLVMAAVIGVAGYAVLNGPLSELRLWLAGLAPQPGEGLDRITARLTGLPPTLIALAAAGALACFALAGPGRRLSRGGALWGVAAGLTVPFGWAATTAAGDVGFDVVPVQSLSFAQPMGETLLFGMIEPWGTVPGFAISAVGGVLLGALVGALIRGEIRWEACDDARELRRQMLGAAMMGAGGILALGCTVGQGLSALSVLSPGAPIAVLSILAGARLGLFVLVEGTAPQR